ncbi:hypothetical protein E2C01_099941 [Portunus trituberculatus]|uniref:Uncharacterized protein n=1 Tax=Portunus trituberculatus TaxID=210409 RepID=A0A5B7K6S3_PORTR|nr:hypothetical protein [Portunus trituberculatus]
MKTQVIISVSFEIRRDESKVCKNKGYTLQISHLCEFYKHSQRFNKESVLSVGITRLKTRVIVCVAFENSLDKKAKCMNKGQPVSPARPHPGDASPRHRRLLPLDMFFPDKF